MQQTTHAPEITPEWKQVIAAVKANQSLFVTGYAGTGKSTLLMYLAEHVLPKENVVRLAYTGLSALRIGGMTIHRFFGFPIHYLNAGELAPSYHYQDKERNKWCAIKTIIVDEISMVRADMMDNMDNYLRKLRANNLPFGGVQMLFFGDPFQLPPVVSTQEERKMLDKRFGSPFFFDSTAFKTLQPRTMLLTKAFRQADHKFLETLNAMRLKQLSSQQMNYLNSRVARRSEETANAILLATTNRIASQENESRLNALPTPRFTTRAVVSGEFPSDKFPTDDHLSLKVGARVMIVANNSREGYVNGTLGRVVGVIERYCEINLVHHHPDVMGVSWEGNLQKVVKSELPNHKSEEQPKQPCIKLLVVRTDGGREVELMPYTWENYAYEYVEEEQEDGSIKGKLKPIVIGHFTQYPVRLAWAITIHKAQGLTLEHATIDFGNGTFAHGQAYVAFSRAQSLEGIRLRKYTRHRR